MHFCTYCGKQLPDGANVCPFCGRAVNPQTNTGQNYTVYQQNTGIDMDVQNNKIIALLSYLGILFLIPMFVKKTSPYCRFHVAQGANLFAFNFVYFIATRILLAIIGTIFPGTYTYYWYTPSLMYSTFNLIFSLGYIFFLILCVIGIINSVKGEKKELPVIGKVKIVPDLIDKIFISLNK